MSPRLKLAVADTGAPVHLVGPTKDPPLQPVNLGGKGGARFANRGKHRNYRQRSPMDVEESIPIGEVPESAVLEAPER